MSLAWFLCGALLLISFICAYRFSLALWHYHTALWAMLRAFWRYQPVAPAQPTPLPQPVKSARQVYQTMKQWRIRRYLAQNTELTLSVLRQHDGLALDAVRQLYSMEARGKAPDRDTFQYPTLSAFGGARPLARTLPKLAPAALRRFGEYPPARRALMAIINPILDLPWQVGLTRPIGQNAHEKAPEPTNEQHARIVAVTQMLNQPNNELSWRMFLQQILEDFVSFGAGPFEVQPNRSDERPLFLWPVDAQSVRINCSWHPGSDKFHYSQSRGYLFSAMGTTDDVYLDDDELCYPVLNARTATPFGLGYLEVAFDTINSFIGSFEYATRRASNATPQFGIFLGENVTIDQVRTWQHYWENEIEGYGKVPILGGGRQPSVFNMQGSATDPLWLSWQEFLIRIIAMSFGLSPMRLGLERDVNRNTAEAGQADDWGTIAPVANAIKDYITHWVFWKRLGMYDLEFQWNIKVSDELKQAEIMLEQYNANAITVDEIRQAYERPPLEDGMGNHTKSAYESLFKVPAGSSKDGEEDQKIVTPFDKEANTDELSMSERHLLRELLRNKRHERHGLQAVAT